jgi:dihydrofolate reductase
MSRVVLYIAMSLDGYIARKDDSLDWLQAFESANEDFGYTAFVAQVGTVIMGGSTYRQVREVLSPDTWPYAGMTDFEPAAAWTIRRMPVCKRIAVT